MNAAEIVAQLFFFTLAWLLGLAGLMNPRVNSAREYMRSLAIVVGTFWLAALIAGVAGYGAVSWALWAAVTLLCLSLPAAGIRLPIRRRRHTSRQVPR